MTRDQKTIFSLIVIVFSFILAIGSCSHMFKQPYIDPVLKNAFDEWVEELEFELTKDKCPADEYEDELIED